MYSSGDPRVPLTHAPPIPKTRELRILRTLRKLDRKYYMGHGPIGPLPTGRRMDGTIDDNDDRWDHSANNIDN